MADTYAGILSEGYGFKIYNTARNRGGLICKTDKGVFEIRRHGGTQARIRFENDVKNHLLIRDFAHVRRYEPTLSGEPYYTAEGTNYVVEAYDGSEAAELTNFDILYDAVRLLASFHKICRDVKSEYAQPPEGKLPEQFLKRKQELVRIKKRIAVGKNHTRIDDIVIKNYEQMFEQLLSAITLLDGCGYSELIRQADEKKTVCHNAFKGENLLVAKEGGFVLSGFHKCCCDYCMTDLAQLIRRHFKSAQANEKSTAAILEEYDRICPLSDNDRLFLCAMLAYPYKFLKICNEYYNKRRVYVSDAMAAKLAQSIEQSQRAHAVINKVL